MVHLKRLGLEGWETREECGKGAGELHVQRRINLKQHSIWHKRAREKNAPGEKSNLRMEVGKCQLMKAPVPQMAKTSS